MKNILLLTGTAVVSILSSSAQAQGVVYSEDFDSFAVTSVNAGVHELGGTTPEVTHGQFFSSSSEVIASGTTLDFTSGNANRTRGAGVWLDTSAWVAGTVTVTFDVSGFVAAVGPDSGAYIQTYTASGVDGSNPVGVDIHGSFNAGVALNGTASSSPLGSATVITAPDMSLTSLTHTFNYSGAGEIGLFFVNKAKNSATEPYQSATLTVDNLSVSLQAGLTIEPNIVLFYVDDLGWQDVQLNDLDTACPYETPNLVALAASGMNFPQAYSPAPTCAPSRGAINTGQHPAKTRFTNVTVNDRSDGRAVERLIAPYLDEQLDPTLLTSADVLKANGYSTGHSGKWHVGLTGASYGFDTVNHQRGPHRSMNPDRNTFAAFATASDPNYPLSMEKYAPFGGSFPQGISYPEDEVTESALQFMEDNKNGPFFLNLCHWMVHYPILTRNKDLLQYYSEKFMHAPDPNPEAGWTGESWNPPLTGDVEWTAPGQNNPYFAAMVTTVDWSLGRIVSYLEATDDPRYPGMKLIDTTYIFFTSDNGGAETRGLEIISENEPLRGKKGNTTDGGIRVPMVVAGPGIAAGSEFNTIVNQLDYFPTFLSLTDTTIAQADFDELSGADLEPVLHGTSAQVIDPVTQLEREFLFWHFPHYGTMYAAVRSGDFKLHYSYDTEIYELYRLSNNGVRVDIEEVVDLAGDPAHAAPLAQLTAMLDGALVANNAELPYLNPNYTGVDPATVAVPDVSSYDSATRSAQLTIDGVGPKIVDAFVIYVTPELNPGDNEVVTEQYMGGMREAAVLSVDGYSVSADIPLSIDSYCFMLVDENGFMQYTDEVASPLFVGPPVILAHWPLDEDSGNQAADISGNDHHATVTGADWSVGVSGGALYFDGINNDTAAIPAGAVSGLDSQVSIAMWAYGGA
ncbi:MAG: sulfatase, partial [Lentimonas sp.]